MNERQSQRFRYDTSGQWFKGNTHIHSTASDGGKSFAELAQMYAAAGYDFLYRTDHRVASDVEADSASYPLLWLDGIEINGDSGRDGGFYHVCCLGTFKGIPKDPDFETAMRLVAEQGGLRILAHPHWSGNTVEEAMRWGFDGVEVYNHVCHWLNGKSHGSVHWDLMLQERPETLGLAVDDAHIVPAHPGWNGGWVMVNTSACTRGAIHEAIASGNFYSTTGPRILSLEYESSTFTVRVLTSPARFIRLVGPNSNGKRLGCFDGEELTSASFRIPEKWSYARLEVEDCAGRQAWTHSLLIPQE